MALLPQFQTNIRELSQMQTQWGSQLNPILANPSSNMAILKNISLSTGTNVINHLLDRTQQGWIITDINAAVTIYRSQPFNDKTLTLVSSGAATVSLGVF